jgi:nucleoside-diphosphate-sugar epimerase
MKGILESPASKAFEGSWVVNDVRDVAAAHILAAENPAAKGRCAVVFRVSSLHKNCNH